MAYTATETRQIRQEIIVGFAAMLLAVVGILLFIQEKYIYYLVGFLSFAAVGWCQTNIKRWVYLAIITIPISPSMPIWKFKNPVTSELSDFVVLVVLLVFFFNYLMSQSKRKGFDSYLMAPLIAYGAVATVSCFAGYYVHYEKMLIINALGHLFKWFSYVGMYFVIFKMFKDEKDLKDLLRVILLAFTLGAAVAAVQYLRQPTLHGRVFRSAGYMEGANVFAGILAVMLLFYFNVIIQQKSKEIFPSWIVYPSLAVILVALVATFSRSGWVALGMGLTVISLLKGRNYIAALAVLMTIAAFLLLGKPVEQRIEMTFEAHPWSTLPIDIGGREGIWKIAVDRLKDTGFWGVGYLNFGQTVMGTMPHNFFLALIGESGPVGLILFIFFLYRLFRAILFLYQHHPDPFFKTCAFGSLVVLAVVLILEFFGEYFYSAPLTFLVFAFYGVSRLSFQNEIDKFSETMRRGKPLVSLDYQWDSFNRV